MNGEMSKGQKIFKLIDQLCKLGNGEEDGNSDGNRIAQRARALLLATEDLTFGDALVLLKRGKKLRRAGWNGAAQYVVYMPGYPERVPANQVTAQAHGIAEGTPVRVLPYMILHTAQGDLAMWAPSSTDALAEDWELAE